MICPSCQADNRAGAKYCKNCAAQLPDSPTTTRPVYANIPEVEATGDADVTLSMPQTPQASVVEVVSGEEHRSLPSANFSAPGNIELSMPQVGRTGTKRLTMPVASAGFLPRPVGAIFADAFVCQSVIFSNGQKHRYKVRMMNVPEERQIRVCPKADCGAVFAPIHSELEKYCTACGAVLEIQTEDLVVTETSLPAPESLLKLAEKGLSHSSVRAPLMAFEERLASMSRYCLLELKVDTLDIAPKGAPDTLQALKWGEELALGLDYLHENGVTFNGQISSDCVGLDKGRIVWFQFACTHVPDGFQVDTLPDLRALALLVFRWLTGRTRFGRDPRLAPGIYRLFEGILGNAESHPAGNHAPEQTAPISTGEQLARLFQKALDEATSPQTLDFRLGRRTHVGMVRNLNEDSILLLELNRIQQSASQLLGLFVIADGMGGHAAGEIASGTIINAMAQLAVKSLLPGHTQDGENDRRSWLQTAVDAANMEVLALRRSSGTDMGSTLVAAVVEGNQAYVAHVGDSRAYLINSKSIQQLTTDHSLVERLVATNQITREEARYHPQRNVIYRTIGDRQKIDVDVSVHTLSAEDNLLLCSDGLSSMLDDRTIHAIVTEAESPQAACDGLINAANLAGGDDNVSAIIVRLVQP